MLSVNLRHYTKDMSVKLGVTEASAAAAVRDTASSHVAEEELKQQLQLVTSEKNTIERMMEELKRKADVAESAAAAAGAYARSLFSSI